MAFHFHWSLGEILDLEHPLRRAFAARARAIVAGTVPAGLSPAGE